MNEMDRVMGDHSQQLVGVGDAERSPAERSGAAPTTTGGGRTPLSAVPDPEVPAKARRRKFTAEYKWRVLVAADECAKPGELGALLRREGLHSSHLTTWRQQRKEGSLRGLSPKKRGKKAQHNPLQEKVEHLERENQRLKLKLEQAHIIIEFQKKACALLGIALKTSPGEESSS